MNDLSTLDLEMTRQLERLACGELDETARAPVLNWLDADPSRWRLCGLAFLEAQAWTETLGQWDQCQAPAMRHPKRETAPQSPFAHAARIAALAASLLIAFVIGWHARPAMSRVGVQPQLADEPPLHMTADPVLASLSVQSPLGAAQPATIQIPVVPSASPTTQVNHEIPDYVRQQWERRGYRVTTERRYLFAKLPDGQQVVVPVEQFVVNRVPAKVY
jgi:hypothetical protein